MIKVGIIGFVAGVIALALTNAHEQVVSGLRLTV